MKLIAALVFLVGASAMASNYEWRQGFLGGIKCAEVSDNGNFVRWVNDRNCEENRIERRRPRQPETVPARPEWKFSSKIQTRPCVLRPDKNEIPDCNNVYRARVKNAQKVRLILSCSDNKNQVRMILNYKNSDVNNHLQVISDELRNSERLITRIQTDSRSADYFDRWFVSGNSLINDGIITEGIINKLKAGNTVNIEMNIPNGIFSESLTFSLRGSSAALTKLMNKCSY